MIEHRSKLYAFSLFVLLIGGCAKLLPPAPESNEILDGPVDGLSPEQRIQFIEGDKAFNDEIFSPSTGLGPYFVSNSCGSCHAGDGKGHPFTTLTRFGQNGPGANAFLLLGGPQLQNRAIPGHQPETLPTGASFSKFTPPANTGLGFLEALSDAQILVNVDSLDSNSDGISGKPNLIRPPSYFEFKPHHINLNGYLIGRFGKKAAAIDLLQQTVNAYNQDMGITSEFSPIEPAINGITSYGDKVPDPEVSTNTIRNLVFYLKTLKVPEPRNTNDPEVIKGKELFISIGCNKCHIDNWTTGNHEINALANKTFHPYTDLLLHDMGNELNDGYSEGIAQNYEWKTPALWGIGLSRNSQGGEYFLLHDGRARTIEEAILKHGGEALNIKNNYVNLTQDEKNSLLKFLENL